MGFLLQFLCPLLQGFPLILSFVVETAHHIVIELFLEILSRLRFEARLPSAEFPRFVFLVVEALFLFSVCSPVPRLQRSFSSFLFASCCRIEASCLPVAVTE